MSSELMGKRVDNLYKNLDVDSRIKAIEDLLNEEAKRKINGLDSGDIKRRLSEIRDAVPTEQIQEYNKRINKMNADMLERHFVIEKLLHLYNDARIITFQKMFLLQTLYEIIIRMNVHKQIQNNKSDIIPIARVAMKSPYWFKTYSPKIDGETVEYPENVCHMFLGFELEDIEIELLDENGRKEIERLETEMKALPEDEESDNKWSELYEKKMDLIPFTKNVTCDGNAWQKLHEEERRLIKEFQELTKTYDASFAERTKDIFILSPDLVYELIEIVAKKN
jgi:hypothetical protein